MIGGNRRRMMDAERGQMGRRGGLPVWDTDKVAPAHKGVA